MRLAYFFRILSIGLIIQGSSVLASEVAFDWKTRFPSDLIDASGKKVDATTLNGKVVGFYFSAHWCGPCRLFTPELVKFANSIKTNSPSSLLVAIVPMKKRCMTT